MKRNMMKTFLAVLTLVCLGLPMKAQMRIEQLAGDNHLIRIAPETEEKYLLLPIEEAAPESQVKVIVNNVQQRQLNIRLALT